MSVLLSLGALLLGATGAEATTTAKEDDPIICTGRENSVVGTRMRPKKICMRKSDWDYQRKHSRRELEDINQRGNNPAPVGEGRAAPR